MKKVLILTQHVFPRPTPRANRATELAKEFARNGHDVTIYAVLGKYDYSHFEKEYNLKVKHIPLQFEVHTYNSDIDNKRVFIDKVTGKLFGKYFEFPNIEFYFKIPKIVKNELDSDLIISIAAPHQIHWGVAKAKQQLGKNFKSVWIADCGDPFMKNGNSTNHLDYFAKFEHLFCEYADFITVPITSAINEYYQEYRGKIHVIPQGFDFDIKALEKKIPQNTNSKPIRFCYAGLLNEVYRNPKPFLELLNKFDLDFEFTIYSADIKLIESFKHLLGDKLILNKPIPRNELLSVFEEMDFLVNIENKNLPGQLPSKLIDYAILRKPILIIKPDSPDEQLINEFLNGNFKNTFVVENVEDYHITNIYKQFIGLFNKIKR